MGPRPQRIVSRRYSWQPQGNRKVIRARFAPPRSLASARRWVCQPSARTSLIPKRRILLSTGLRQETPIGHSCQTCVTQAGQIEGRVAAECSEQQHGPSFCGLPTETVTSPEQALGKLGLRGRRIAGGSKGRFQSLRHIAVLLLQDPPIPQTCRPGMNGP